MKLKVFNKILLTFLILFITGCSSDANKLSVTLNKCIDGDTAKFNLNGQIIKARFLAINTPEIDSKDYYSYEAKEYTCKLLKESEVTIEYDNNSDKTDKYGRHLVWVFVNGELLQDKIVLNGYGKVAYLYDEYKYTNQLIESQEIAKNNMLGVWNSH